MDEQMEQFNIHNRGQISQIENNRMTLANSLMMLENLLGQF